MTESKGEEKHKKGKFESRLALFFPMACKVCALIVATQSVASLFLQAKLPEAGDSFVSSFCGQHRDEDEEHHFLLGEGSLVTQHTGKAGEPWLCLQPSLCWQLYSPAQACGCFSRSQFIYSQVAFNLHINSCKNILSYVTNLGSVCRFQAVVKGTWGQPSS